jgi:hypothetical protein
MVCPIYTDHRREEKACSFAGWNGKAGQSQNLTRNVDASDQKCLALYFSHHHHHRPASTVVHHNQLVVSARAFTDVFSGCILRPSL